MGGDIGRIETITGAQRATVPLLRSIFNGVIRNKNKIRENAFVFRYTIKTCPTHTASPASRTRRCSVRLRPLVGILHPNRRKRREPIRQGRGRTEKRRLNDINIVVHK
jgi:hypothetical protein